MHKFLEETKIVWTGKRQVTISAGVRSTDNTISDVDRIKTLDTHLKTRAWAAFDKEFGILSCYMDIWLDTEACLSSWPIERVTEHNHNNASACRRAITLIDQWNDKFAAWAMGPGFTKPDWFKLAD